MDEKTRANREAWDQFARTHYEHYDIPKLLAGGHLLSELIVSEVGEVRGKRLLHLLCHIGTDTLSWARLGAQVSGVDISPEAIRYARLLAEQLGIPANFWVADVMDLPGQVTETYDVAFASTGVLCWIPDLERFAAAVRALLKPGGVFYLHDGHPFRTMLEPNEAGEQVIRHNYFQAGATGYQYFTDYTDSGLVVPLPNYEWTWTLGQVVTAFASHGLRILFLHEHAQYFYSGYPGTDVEINRQELYPCTFSLKAVAV